MDRTVYSNITQYAKFRIVTVRSVLSPHTHSLYTQSLVYPSTN